MTKQEALKILELGQKFTQEQAKASYRLLARKYHPDIAGIQFNAKFAQINEAYAIVSKLGDSLGCILSHKDIFNVERV